jgi:branched-chain amino acid transport system ATP-binding protein
MILEIKDLRVRYGGAEVVKGISLQVDDGDIVTLIGNNGAGKTTTLRAISGLKSPDDGEIYFEGKRIDKLSPQNIVKAGIYQVPQGSGCFPYMSVSENLRLGAFLRKDQNGIKQDMEEILEHFPILGKRKNQQAGTLSGGEQQMLAIACALMGKPKLLMFDEPSSGLSPLMLKEIGIIINDINNRGTSILLVEQNARLALRLANRCYVLETGNIILEGKSEELVKNEIIKKAYLGQEI